MNHYRDVFVDAAGLRTRVRSTHSNGNGRTALVLHGFTGSIESMQCTSDALSVGRPVLSMDLVGHGETETPTRADAYTMDSCVSQLAAALDVLTPSPVHVVGYSMGGRAALSLAVAHPAKVASLVLVGASTGLSDPVARAARVAADETLARTLETEGLERFVDAWMALPLFASQTHCGAKFLAAARAQRLRSNPVGLAGSLRGMGTGAMRPLDARLNELERPVCLVAGALDEKFTHLAAEICGQLPDARSEILDGVGHAAHIEAPAEFGRVANQFLREIDEPDLGDARLAASVAAQPHLPNPNGHKQENPS